MDRYFQMKHLKRQWISAKNLTRSLPAALSDPILRAAPITSLLCQMKIKLWFSAVVEGKMHTTAIILQAKQVLIKQLDASTELLIFWCLHRTAKCLWQWKDQVLFCATHTERCLLEEGICVGKELHTWKNAVLRLWGHVFCFFFVVVVHFTEENTLNRDRG